MLFRIVSYIDKLLKIVYYKSWLVKKLYKKVSSVSWYFRKQNWDDPSF